MILTCPECASRYFVDDARVGPRGRTVRCAGCGHTWRSEPAPDLEAPLALGGETAAISDEPSRDPPLPERLRAEALEKQRTRQAVAAGVAWGAVGAGFVAVILAAVLFRVDVVRLWPKTASAYAFAKMPVNPTGLTFEGVQGKPNLIHGRAALTVTGVERNIETEPRPAMPLRVILLDRSGKRLASAVSAPPTLRLAAGAGRPFSVDFLDPPADVSSALVEVDFDKPPPPPPPPPRPAAPPAATSPSPAAARNPAPAAEAVPLAPIRAQNARPLPADSPYALPPAARQQASR